MTGRWFLAGCALVTITLMYGFRYQMINDSGPGVLRINRWTGQVCVIWKDSPPRIVCGRIGFALPT